MISYYIFQIGLLCFSCTLIFFLSRLLIKTPPLHHALTGLSFLLLVYTIFLVQFDTITELEHSSNLLAKVDLHLRYIPKIIYNDLSVGLSPPLDDSKIDLPKYYLFIKEEEITKQDKQLRALLYHPDPLPGFILTKQLNDIEGDIIINGSTYNAKYRYRGGGPHYLMMKKSWRVNLKGDYYINYSNKFNLVNPKWSSHLRMYLGTDLAERLHILGVRSEPVAVYLNGEYYGVYNYINQVDQYLITALDLLPGHVYFGDGPGENLYVYPENWDIQDTYNDNVSEANATLIYLMQSIMNSTPEQFQEFFTHRLGEEFIEFTAYNLLIGNAHTATSGQNIRLYYNPGSGKFVFLEWDPHTFLNETPGFVSYNEITNKIVEYPYLVESVQKKVYSFMQQLPESAVTEIIDTEADRISYEMFYDPYKDFSLLQQWSITYPDWEKAVLQLKIDVRNQYRNLDYYLTTANITIYTQPTDLIMDIDGFVGVNVTVRSCQDNTCNSEELVTLFPGSKERGMWTISKIHAPKRYKFSRPPGNLSFSAFTTLTHTTVPVILNNDSELPELLEILPQHKWITKEKKEMILSGDILLNTSIILDEAYTLTIAPGSTLTLLPHVSIITRGILNLNGTKDMPITIQAMDNSQPWGVIAIQGGTAHFRYCIISDGSIAEHEFIHYTGMISIHDSNAMIDHCIFSNNHIGDDMLNAKLSNISIMYSQFFNSAYDAIDFDKSEGNITHSLFINPGNDAIDLSLSSPLIENITVMEAGDKGISIGEKSNPIVRRTRILNSTIGIAIKDMSNPVLYMPDLIGNDFAIAVYQKKPEYLYGGRGTVIQPFLLDNTKNIMIDPAEYSVAQSSMVIIQNETSIAFCSAQGCILENKSSATEQKLISK